MNPRTRSLAVLLFVVCALAGACTSEDGGEGEGARGQTPTGSPPPTVDQGPVEFVPGAFRYEFGDVTAELTLAADAAGTLDVRNASGAELAAPAIYLLTGDDSRVDATIADAASIPDGDRASFQVTFADAVDIATLGLVILEFGDDNYGGMAPVIADQG